MQKTPHKKKYSALPVIHENNHFIASKLPNMFAKVWCYRFALYASSLRHWFFLVMSNFFFLLLSCLFSLLSNHRAFNLQFFISLIVLVWYEVKTDKNPNYETKYKSSTTRICIYCKKINIFHRNVDYKSKALKSIAPKPALNIFTHKPMFVVL